MYSFPSVFLLVGSFVFLLLSFQSSLYILDTWQELLGLHFTHAHHPPSHPTPLFHWNYSSWGRDCTLKIQSILTSSSLLALLHRLTPLTSLNHFFLWFPWKYSVLTLLLPFWPLLFNLICQPFPTAPVKCCYCPAFWSIFLVFGLSPIGWTHIRVFDYHLLCWSLQMHISRPYCFLCRLDFCFLLHIRYSYTLHFRYQFTVSFTVQNVFLFLYPL